MSPVRTAGCALRELVHSTYFENPVALTLTMKKRVAWRVADAIMASRNFRHFRNRLERALFGNAAKRHGKRLKLVAVIETSADQRLHYHCIVDRPSFCSFERFSGIIREQWSKTDFGYYQIDIQDQADDGWTDYILKQRQKCSLLDSIDWDNCNLIVE
jgi:hypothetical protein